MGFNMDTHVKPRANESVSRLPLDTQTDDDAYDTIHDEFEDMSDEQDQEQNPANNYKSMQESAEIE